MGTVGIAPILGLSYWKVKNFAKFKPKLYHIFSFYQKYINRKKGFFPAKITKKKISKCYWTYLGTAKKPRLSSLWACLYLFGFWTKFIYIRVLWVFEFICLSIITNLPGYTIFGNGVSFSLDIQAEKNHTKK